jgi:hypothetical protein
MSPQMNAHSTRAQNGTHEITRGVCRNIIEEPEEEGVTKHQLDQYGPAGEYVEAQRKRRSSMVERFSKMFEATEVSLSWSVGNEFSGLRL